MKSSENHPEQGDVLSLHGTTIGEKCIFYAKQCRSKKTFVEEVPEQETSLPLLVDTLATYQISLSTYEAY